MSDERVSDAELQALVDGQIEAPRRAEIEAWVARDPELAERLRSYRAINRDLRELFRPVLEETPPAHLLRGPPRARPVRLRHAAVAAAWMLLGGLMGAYLGVARTPATTPVETALVRPAAFAHAIYAPEVRHPVEVRGDRGPQLTRWLSKRLKTSLTAPPLDDLGYRLLGGRLLPSTDRMAAQFMYEDQAGRRVTLYIRRGDWGRHATAFHYAREDGVGLFYWIEAPMGYALAGDLPRGELLRIANAVYGALDT